MQREAKGSFHVTLKPLSDTGAPIGSMSIHKTFQGDLVGDSVGQMLAFRSSKDGSAGYVAMEQVTGTLQGRHGTFVLQHSGTMSGGSQSAVIAVVPDSGTAGLAGLTGSMKIQITANQHDYAFDYALPN